MPVLGSQVTQIEEVGEGKALAPSFLKLPTDTEVQEGKLVRLECRTAGKPPPDVSTAAVNIRQVHKPACTERVCNHK